MKSVKLIDVLNGDVTYPACTINDNGKAVIAWSQVDSTTFYRVRYRTYTPSSNLLSSVKLIESLDNTSASNVHSAINNSGDMVVSWMQKYNGFYSIYANYYSSSDNSWSGEELLENMDNYAYYPISGLSENGDAVVSWHQKDSSNKYRLFANVYR